MGTIRAGHSIGVNHEKETHSHCRSCFSCGRPWLAFMRSRFGRGDAKHASCVSGNIELTEVNIAFKTAGKLIERDGGRRRRGEEGPGRSRGWTATSWWRSAAAEAAPVGGIAAHSAADHDRDFAAWESHAGGRYRAARAELKAAEARLAELGNGSASAGKAGRAGGRGPAQARVRPLGERLDARADAVQERRHLDRAITTSTAIAWRPPTRS